MSDDLPPTTGYKSFLGLGDEESVSAYAGQALQQAADLLSVVTGASRPADAGQAQRLYDNAVYSMAEALEVNKGSRAQHLSPYRSEQIGSFRYELVASRSIAGAPTGILWWDMAVQQYTTDSAPLARSAHMFDRVPPDLEQRKTADGDVVVLGTADMLDIDLKGS